MKRIQFFSLLGLLITLPLNITAADINIIWVRTGVVLETEHKNDVEGEINIAFKAAGMQHTT